jgi:hypothetical protein
MSGVLRVGNCSGFYGDRLSAMREMLEGGELDVLTGDYLAELTMLILGRDQMKDPSSGYARTFLKQVTENLRLAHDRGVKIVANAGGLNPAGLAARLQEVAAAQGLATRVAYVDGDNLIDRTDELGLSGDGKPLTANAYLGAYGVAAALSRGADIVVTGRVTDASVVVGPAIAHFGWSRTSYDQLAGAVVAGHVIECGAQACGGNFSGFRALLEHGRADRPIGFPIAEISEDGSCVITKHPGTGGLVDLDTVTAQLVYEIQSTVYLGPDVTTHLDSIHLSEDGPDRVRISNVVGSPPPSTAKVCLNELGGFRNSMELVLTGLDIDAKAEWVRRQVESAWDTNRPHDVEWALARTDNEDADTEEAASARLRVTVRDQAPEKVGKLFTAPLVELALASYPGFTMTSPPGPATPYGVYRAGYVPQSEVPHVVHHHDSSVEQIQPPRAAQEGEGRARPTGTAEPAAAGVVGLGPPSAARGGLPAAVGAAGPGETTRVPLGTFVHARSGDKGGDANLGLWVSSRDDSGLVERRAQWLSRTVTPEFVQLLLPETAELDVEVYPLPNLRAVNVVIKGLLGQGVAASSRFDPQAKGLGEWARSRLVEVPEELV